MSKSKLDAPVNTVVSYRKKQLKIMFSYTCKDCYFERFDSCTKRPCCNYQRLDNTTVIFKLVTNEQV